MCRIICKLVGFVVLAFVLLLAILVGIVLYKDDAQMQEWGKAIHNYHSKYVRFLGDAIVKLGKMVPYIVRDKFIVNDFVIGLAVLLTTLLTSLVWFVGRMKDVEYKG